VSLLTASARITVWTIGSESISLTEISSRSASTPAQNLIITAISMKIKCKDPYADMTVCGMSAFAVAIGVKRTWLVAAPMSAFDPKRTSRDGVATRI
jgi:hypothetical protein